jgi:hypothetical protein
MANLAAYHRRRRIRGENTIVTRRSSILALAGLGLAACGGGGGGSGSETPPIGVQSTRSIAARRTGTHYPLTIYRPREGDARSVPVVYLLDGEPRFAQVVNIAEAMRVRIVVVGIGNEPMRSRDYVPMNSCTANGGGHADYFDFIRQELIPSIEADIGGDPQQRILLGHSHGGSFVLYALFAESGASRSFRSYLASDASIGCLESTAFGWESAYAAAHTALPARLHVSHAGNLPNLPFTQQIQQRRYAGLSVVLQQYGGGHLGMIPAAFTDALAFALA